MREKISMITIKELSNRKNLIQAELADLLMLTEAEAKKFEEDQPMIPSSAIVILALYLHVSIDKIVGIKGAEINPYTDDFPY